MRISGRLINLEAAIWDASFLFIDIGLEALRPGVIALSRTALGVVALAYVLISRLVGRVGAARGAIGRPRPARPPAAAIVT